MTAYPRHIMNTFLIICPRINFIYVIRNYDDSSIAPSHSNTFAAHLHDLGFNIKSGCPL